MPYQAESVPPKFCCDSSASRLNMTQKGVHTLCEILDNRLAVLHIILLWPYGLSTLSRVVSGIAHERACGR
jgi:hypothetical protein